MILQPNNVELTKVHYYDKTRWSQNMSVSTISREVHQNNYNKNILVKNNVFGHKWVLRINQGASNEDPKRGKRRKVLVFLCVSVFLSIIIALFLGVVLSLDFNIFRVDNKNVPNLSTIIAPTENYLNTTVTRDLETANNENQPTNITTVYPGVSKGNNASGGNDTTPKISFNSTSPYCRDCTINEICFKTSEIERPKCVRIVNKNDPTGCGGLCKINTQFCKNLDKNFHVYQCLDLKNRLQCPENTFNCENMCISLSKRCDGRVDCSNLLDEKNCECNLETHFQCGNQTSCLERNKYCNGKVDCWDKSDEITCLKEDNFSNTFCEENYIPCLNGQCIPKEKLCDNVFDCSDRTDEPLWCQQINRKK
ncbi:LDL receptor repeat-containing protein egg-2-like [Euwallacea similis]|uniref:LDL receptor repeat-containing protein egg-2-like n=1 Tax=Euwallacea similis TaxID=1736056 RepID=UPI00344FA2E3